MDNTNLFKHAPKELVTDAFLTWLFYFLDSNEKFQKDKQDFFNKLLLRPDDLGKTIYAIEVNRQLKVKNGRIDLLLEFRLQNNTEKILFENKTWTSTSKSQLQKYKEGFPNLYKYIYLKLAYINYYKRQLLKNLDYNFITSEMLVNSLKQIAHLHPFIQQYMDYINQMFVKYINSFKVSLFENNNINILRDGQPQEYLMDILYENLENKLSYLKFKTGSSSGRPWTELDIARKENIYGNIWEFLFWRIDIRKGKFYIRLNQYAYIKETNNIEFKRKKKERLTLLREIASNINLNYSLKPGKLSNSGVNESEIIVFFLRENNMKKLMKILPLFSIEIVEEYNNRL